MMYKYRGRHTQIVFGQPLPPKTTPPQPVYKNIVAMAAKIEEYLAQDPQRTHTIAGANFGITRSRISQLMTILEKLPADFISILKTTKDQTLIKRFSGKTLLKIANLGNPEERQEEINRLLPKT